MRRISAESLIELACTALRDEIQPSVPPSGRYALAMSLRALEIARREIVGESDAITWEILDRVYDDGEGSMKMLAADIRSGKVSDETYPALRADLVRLLVSELEIRNPRALARRSSKDVG